MNIDDGRLMAYVDGELDAALAARVEAAIAADPALAERVERHRALRARLGDAYARVLDEPVPERLRAVLGTASTGAAPQVSSLHLAPTSSRRTRPRWSAREWTAMAASLLLGVLLARGLPLPQQEASSDSALVDAAMRARGGLAQALDQALAGEPAAARVAVGLSFRARDGGYCRSFRIADARPLAGLACRGDGDTWRVTTLAEAGPAAGDGLRQASTALPASVLADVDARIEGDPLDAGQERAARDARWR